MKTVAEIAREIGVSKVAIHKKIKQEPLKSSLQQFTKTIDNALRIDNEGEQLIKSAFSNRQSLTENDESITKKDNTSETYVDELITSLRNENQDLRQQINKFTQQLDEERKYNKELASQMLPLIAQAQELASNAQKLHAMGNVNPQLKDNKNISLLIDANGNEQPETATVASSVEPEPTKTSIFSRIFKRDKNK